MPNRILRESILDSERVNALSAEAEVFYRRLMSVVDDYGRFPADPRILRSRCYPLRTDEITCEQINNWLNECTLGDDPLVLTYECTGKPFLQLENLGEPRAKRSKYPDPRACGCNRTHADVSGCVQMIAGRVAQTPAKAKADTKTDNEIENSDSEDEMRWQLDETYLPIVEMYRKFKGGGVIDRDFSDAYWTWTTLDWEQKQARIERLRWNIENDTYSAPEMLCSPRKFIDSEWERERRPCEKVRPMPVKQAQQPDRYIDAREYLRQQDERDRARGWKPSVQ